MSARVSYGRLTKSARDTIIWSYDGATIAGYIRHHDPDGRWSGDACGCPDDRCIGYHHDAHEECGCLDVSLSDYYLDVLAPSWWVVSVSGVGDGWLRVPVGERVELSRHLQKASADAIAASWRASGYTVELILRERAESTVTARVLTGS